MKVSHLPIIEISGKEKEIKKKEREKVWQMV